MEATIASVERAGSARSRSAGRVPYSHTAAPEQRHHHLLCTAINLKVLALAGWRRRSMPEQVEMGNKLHGLV